MIVNFRKIAPFEGSNIKHRKYDIYLASLLSTTYSFLFHHDLINEQPGIFAFTNVSLGEIAHIVSDHFYKIG